jgi:hypothetical protein
MSGVTRFFFAEVDARPVKWFRVALGTLMIAWLIACAPHWSRDYAPQGMLSLDTLGPTVTTGVRYSVIEQRGDRVSSDAWWWITLGLTVAYLLGWWPRVASVGLLAIHLALQQRNWWESNAEQTMFRALLFYGLVLPLDGRAVTMAAWRVRSVQLHCCWMYVVSSPWKWFSDEAWRNGTAMYYVLIDPVGSRWPWPQIAYDRTVAALMTYGSLAMEASFPWLVWIAPLRSWVAAGMIGFHVMLAVVLRHIEFFTLSMGCALILSLKGDEGERVAAFVRRLISAGMPGRPVLASRLQARSSEPRSGHPS